MGLLKGAGRRLKGLFGDGGLVDTLAEAQAWLEGDYERGMALAGRNRRPARKIHPKDPSNRSAGRSEKASEEGPLDDTPLPIGRQYDPAEWRWLRMR